MNKCKTCGHEIPELEELQKPIMTRKNWVTERIKFLKKYLEDHK